MNTDTDQRTPAGLKVFLLAVAVLVVLGLAYLADRALAPFDSSADGRPAFSAVPTTPDTSRPIPAFSLMRRAHSARIAS